MEGWREEVDEERVENSHWVSVFAHNSHRRMDNSAACSNNLTICWILLTGTKSNPPPSPKNRKIKRNYYWLAWQWSEEGTRDCCISPIYPASPPLESKPRGEKEGRRERGKSLLVSWREQILEKHLTETPPFVSPRRKTKPDDAISLKDNVRRRERDAEKWIWTKHFPRGAKVASSSPPRGIEIHFKLKLLFEMFDGGSPRPQDFIFWSFWWF